MRDFRLMAHSDSHELDPAVFPNANMTEVEASRGEQPHLPNHRQVAVDGGAHLPREGRGDARDGRQGLGAGSQTEGTAAAVRPADASPN